MAEIGTDISKAKSILDRGGLVAIPTETVYGLAGNALNEESLIRIFEVKQRPKFDPLIAHIDSDQKLELLTGHLPETFKRITDSYWPGPLTILCHKKPGVPDLLTSGLPTVAIRMPDHPLSLSLLKTLEYPLAAPSANPFGYISPTTAEHVNDQLGGNIDYILDGGPTRVGIESTIIGYDGDIIIHRQGKITNEDLEQFGVIHHVTEKSQPVAPGQLKSHYAPKKRVILGDLDMLVSQHIDQNLGVLSFQKNYHNVSLNYVLSPSGDLHESARNLFKYLRLLDQSSVDLILVERCPSEGIGIAINDRLTRASIKD
ncbi:ywlC [Symbiodinium microadriaticum]|nr:ywlC [Symbiodinium microadriaticum]